MEFLDLKNQKSRIRKPLHPYLSTKDLELIIDSIQITS